MPTKSPCWISELEVNLLLISSKSVEIPIREGAKPSRPVNNEQQHFHITVMLHICSLHTSTYLLPLCAPWLIGQQKRSSTPICYGLSIFAISCFKHTPQWTPLPCGAFYLGSRFLHTQSLVVWQQARSPQFVAHLSKRII